MVSLQYRLDEFKRSFEPGPRLIARRERQSKPLHRATADLKGPERWIASFHGQGKFARGESKHEQPN
jgi:hypothetical protein